MPHLAGGIKGIADVVLTSRVEDGSHDLDAACLGSVAQVDFQHLPHIHTGRHAQRVHKALIHNQILPLFYEPTKTHL